MSDIVDLDVLIPQEVIIRFGGEEITVPPPKTVQVLKIGLLGQKLQDADKLSNEELEKAISDLSDQVMECVPGLSGKDLNMAQLLKLVEIISNMAIPPDSKELDKRGISTASPKAP